MTELNFKQNFAFDLCEHRFGTLSLIMSQFNCNCVSFGISLGHTWRFAKTFPSRGTYSLVDNTYFLMKEFRETVLNCTFHCSLLCTKSQVEKVHLFLSEELICIFKHSMDALPVAAQWLMFKHTFAFGKNSCEKE